MNIEVLLLINVAGLTLLAYLIAINAHGPTRLGLSYLIATLMLAGTVWVVVQHVNAGVGLQHRQEMQQAEQKLREQEEALRSQTDTGQEQRIKMALVEKLRPVATRGTALASRLTAIDLRDRSVDYDMLVSRAINAVNESEQIRQDFEAIAPSKQHYVQASESFKEALQLLKEATYYYRTFYSAEDSDQEDLRSRIMRQKARAALEQFQKASGQLAL